MNFFCFINIHNFTSQHFINRSTRYQNYLLGNILTLIANFKEFGV